MSLDFIIDREAKVMFLHLSVTLFTGGCITACTWPGGRVYVCVCRRVFGRDCVDSGVCVYGVWMGGVVDGCRQGCVYTPGMTPDAIGSHNNGRLSCSN